LFFLFAILFYDLFAQPTTASSSFLPARSSLERDEPKELRLAENAARRVKGQGPIMNHPRRLMNLSFLCRALSGRAIKIGAARAGEKNRAVDNGRHIDFNFISPQRMNEWKLI
jgi:hypothetical protein